MKRKEVVFNPEEFVTSVERFAAGKEHARETTLKLPPPVGSMSAKQIRAIRKRLGYTQVQFAALLNVPKVTEISWENGARKPSGAALRLLEIAKNHPEVFQGA